ncbi:MAG TPA: efflux RND transporter periplasmic adaptor subunit [Acidobacteriota bacterium]|nr:efflux RND transporter periplasmic adaptor subunit [Acidobacteriota bacterium]HQF85608.1 efflux RND transporter periplasmic adaptor subunit [Acidobacteriota bacterium]HQG91148.1 efflux RND transporter periplasmic adaptor subunit [Acidobacteriota bacterium]HQK86665.1 efflux RND transporter periplasmic adaptor subunit [Acidobacteriota bacterium]
MANRKGSTALRIVTVVVIIGILGGVYTTFSILFRRDESIPAEKITTVARGEMVRSVVATGKIEPVSKIDIKSKASGIIRFLYVDDGDHVREGQVLLELDREQLEASRREAHANMMARKAMLEKAEAEVRSTALALERAREEAESRDLEFVRREWERMKSLYEDNLISKADLDATEQRWRAEQVRDKVLQRNVLLRESEHITAQKAVHQAQADLYAMEAALQRSEEELANATIRSPINGMVLKRYLEVGDAVSSILQLGSNATLVMTIGDTRDLYFRGAVDESDVGQVRVGLPVNITVETYRDKIFPGEVTLISPMGQERDNVTRFEVRVRIPGETTGLRANMSANAEVILEKKSGVLIISETALVYDERKASFVDRVTGEGDRQKVDRVSVKVGISNGSRVELLEGLKEGERVVLQ